eukprot:CAMPEP_0181313710 /NCGR_PEP_ID=MMETSP1101-20121128/14400_1 /TAXON_ID=46948 /ORGANISM="Rhodomonas abbreviata, Strain Caron Lab Isolate" /LENGTH=534 /DNA_ID=CAMNT_0023420695 /DNA_START=85 /DNA_END=1689 /DNA_ORIENTATION=+
MSSEAAVRAEERAVEAEIASVQSFMNSERFKHIKRTFTAKDVVAFKGTYAHSPKSAATAAKLYSLCRDAFNKGTYNKTFGALDPVQVTQMAEYINCVYVSGWQCSSTASTSNEPGPDFADYPANTVPNKVDQLFRAQLLKDRQQREERMRMTPEERRATKQIDFMRPIIADGDTGFGGVTSVMKLVKMHVEAGAAGVHIEDQSPGTKKCGHMGGKCLIPVREQIVRMNAARLQCDIMGVETVLISRTDAEAATFIISNIDSRDHPFIGGATNPSVGSLNDAVDERGPAYQTQWLEECGLKRYPEAIADAMRAKNASKAAVDAWLAAAYKLSHSEARRLATKNGFGDVFWDWEAPRAREGYYRVVPGIDYSAARAIAFSECSDLIWMETATPNVEVARGFAEVVHAAVPNQMLAYNCSPSFNWAAFLSPQEIASFQQSIAKFGFAWQFITLAGFHANGLKITEFARDYASDRGMLAYVERIQGPEGEQGVSTLTHQKWSGADFFDNIMSTASGGMSSTLSQQGSTEAQFAKKSKL